MTSSKIGDRFIRNVSLSLLSGVLSKGSMAADPFELEFNVDLIELMGNEFVTLIEFVLLVLQIVSLFVC